MISNEQMRQLALSMPESEEKSHFGHPDFRVKNKIFATLWPDDRRAVLKLGRERQRLVIAAEPYVFSVAPGGERGGWTRVDLACVSRAMLRPLVVAAWCQTAPKRLAKEYLLEKQEETPQ